jgi:hypothetical protein
MFMATEKSPQGEVRDDGTRGVLHLIEDDISETWIEDWAAAGVKEIEDTIDNPETYLGKHVAFLAFITKREGRVVQE